MYRSYAALCLAGIVMSFSRVEFEARSSDWFIELWRSWRAAFEEPRGRKSVLGMCVYPIPLPIKSFAVLMKIIFDNLESYFYPLVVIIFCYYFFLTNPLWSSVYFQFCVVTGRCTSWYCFNFFSFNDTPTRYYNKLRSREKKIMALI